MRWSEVAKSDDPIIMTADCEAYTNPRCHHLPQVHPTNESHEHTIQPIGSKTYVSTQHAGGEPRDDSAYERVKEPTKSFLVANTS